MLLKRKRLFDRLKLINKNSLTICSAPKGYGKSTAIKTYCEENNIDRIWLDLAMPVHSHEVWSKLQRELSKYLVLDILLEKNTDDIKTLKRYIDIANEELKKDLFVVFSNYNDQIFSKLSYLLFTVAKEFGFVSKIHFVILANEVKDINLLNCIVTKKCLLLSVHDFAMDMKEISTFYKMNGIRVAEDDINQMHQFTGGWLEAIKASIMEYNRSENIYSFSSINDYLETEVLRDLEKKEIIELSQLSLFNEFTFDFLSAVTSDETVKLVSKLESNCILFMKNDTKTYRVTPLFKQFLNQYILKNDKLKSEVIKKASIWYIANRNPIEALSLYANHCQFKQMMDLIEIYDVSLMDLEPEKMLRIYEKIPNEYAYQYPYIYLGYIRDLLTGVNPDRGFALLEGFRKELNAGKYEGDFQFLLGEYYFIRAFTQFNKLKNMLEDFRKASDLFEGKSSRIAYPKMTATFGSCSMLYLYHCVVGELESLVNTVKSDSKYFIEIAQGVNAGCDYQIQAEHNYEIGEYENVLDIARFAYIEAKRNQQTSICICSLYLQGKMSYIAKNKYQFEQVLDELQNYYNQEELPIIKSEIECAISLLYLLHDQPNKVAQWVKDSDVSTVALIHESWSLAYIIILVYALKTDNFSQVLRCAQVLEKSYNKQMHIFGMLYVYLGRAYAHLKIGDKNLALKNFELLLDVARKDKLISFFIEFKEISQILLHEFKERIDAPKKLIEACDYHESRYKKLSVLSDKELSIALTYLEVKSLQELANNLFLSKNTVKFHLKNIFRKLSVSTKADLIVLFKDLKERI